MLTTKWHSLFSITITTLFIILITHISPVVASSKLLLARSIDNYYLTDSTGSIVVADNSVSSNPLHTNKQKQSILLERLNLTSSQKNRIRQIHDRYKQQIRKKKNSLNLLQQELSDLMVGTEPVELIRAKNQQLVDLRQEIGQLRFESMLATREILTPQQRQKFREIIESQVTE